MNFFFLRLHRWHMEVPGLGVQLELQLQDYATATAMPDVSHISDLCCSLQQCGILNPLNEASHRTFVFMDTSWALNLLSHNGNSSTSSLLNKFILLCEVFSLSLPLPFFSFSLNQYGTRRKLIITDISLPSNPKYFLLISEETIWEKSIGFALYFLLGSFQQIIIFQDSFKWELI